jgi:CheY-specific phosphatase CheX
MESREDRESPMTTLPRLHLDERLASTLCQAIDETLTSAFQINTQVKDWHVGKKEFFKLDLFDVCQININQQNILCGAFILALDREIILHILRQYGDNEGNDPEKIEDAAEEITNMIFGTFKTEMNGHGYRLSMDLPFTPHSKEEIIDQYGDSEKMFLPFVADGHPCQVIVVPKPLA